MMVLKPFLVILSTISAAVAAIVATAAESGGVNLSSSPDIMLANYLPGTVHFPIHINNDDIMVSRRNLTAHKSNSSSTELVTINYNGLIGYNGTDPFNIIAESRSSSSFILPIQTQLFMCLLYGMLTFIAVTSNMIVCYIVLSNQRMRTATNYFIVNLAVGDILMALLCIPFTFPANLIFQYWPFGLSLCVVVSYSQANSVFISAYTMVAISIDKYLAIMYPMRLRMSKTQAKIIILVIWSAALLTSLPTALLSSIELLSPDSSNSTFEASAPTWPTSPLLVTQTLTTSASTPAAWLPAQRDQFNADIATTQIGHRANKTASQPNTLINDESKSTTVTISESQSSNQQQHNVIQQQQGQRKYICQESWNFWPQGKYYYSMALMILQFVLPLFVLVITYSRIVIVVWGKRMPGEEDNARDARMARSKRKMIKMVIFCVIAFALTWLPFNALIVIGDMHPDIWENSSIMYIWFITHYLAMCHTITNPLIYIWMNNRFRAGFGRVIGDIYMTAKLAIILIWYYCCCMGVCLKCSQAKHHRMASNMRRKRSQMMTGGSCLTNNAPITNHTSNTLTNNQALGNPALHPLQQTQVTSDGMSLSNQRVIDQREIATPNDHRRTRAGTLQSPANSRVIENSQQSKSTTSARVLLQDTSLIDRSPHGQKSSFRIVHNSEKILGYMVQKPRKKKWHNNLLGGHHRRERSDNINRLEEIELAEKLKRVTRRKRRKHAQSHVINLCLTSTQPRGKSCIACKRQTAPEDKQNESRIRGDIGRQFIADMCRSSQSTATISIHTNTTSLAISPLCSKTATANNTSNNTSASSGEQPNYLGNVFEKDSPQHRDRRKIQQKTSYSDKELEGGNVSKGYRVNDVPDRNILAPSAKCNTEMSVDYISSLESSNDRSHHFESWSNPQHCHRHAVTARHSGPAVLNSGDGFDDEATTDDDVGDVFHQTVSLGGNNKRNDSNSYICSNQSDDNMDDYRVDDDSLEAEYGDRPPIRREILPMIRLIGEHNRRANVERQQIANVSMHIKQKPHSQRHKMKPLKRLFRSMGDDLSPYNGAGDCEWNDETIDESNNNHRLKESTCFLPEKSAATFKKSASSSGSKNDHNGMRHTTSSNYRPIMTASEQYTMISEASDQRVRSLRRTMLLNNHLISSTSRIPDRIDRQHPSTRKVFSHVDKDASANITGCTPLMHKQSEKALSDCSFLAARTELRLQPSGIDDCDEFYLQPASTPVTTTPQRSGRGYLEGGGGGRWSGALKSDPNSFVGSGSCDHQSSSALTSSPTGAKAFVLSENGGAWLELEESNNGTGCSMRQVRLAAKSTKKAYSLDSDETQRLISPGANSVNRLSRCDPFVKETEESKVAV